MLSLIGALPARRRPHVAGRATGRADVPPTHLSYRDVAATVAAGVMTLDGGAFRLLDSVSGAQAMDIIGRLEALAR